MNTAKTALLTHQMALEVTGQNIANVNNPNYSRQELLLESSFPIQPSGAPGLIGTGVRATTIIRRFDQFLESQRTLNKSNTQYWDSRQDFLSRLEVVYNESRENGLNRLFDDFYLSFQDLAFNPNGLTERTNVEAQGRNVSIMFNKLSKDITNLRIDLNTKIASSVDEVNRITDEISKLNEKIHEVEIDNVTANDFRDKRESLIRDLSAFAEVSVVEDSSKQVMVSLKNGRTLVIGQTAFKLSTKVRSDDAPAVDIMWADASGATTSITSEIENGSLGSWIEMRDTEFLGYKDKLDILAGTFIRDVNNLHSAGYGLNGGTGQDFFTANTIKTTNGKDNTGTGAISSGSIVDPENVSLHKYEITVTASGSTFDVKDLTTGTTTTGVSYTNATNIPYFQSLGINVQISAGAAVGDKFTAQAGADAALNIKVDSAISSDLNKIAAGLTTDNGDGDNALKLSQLQNDLKMNKTSPSDASGTATFSEYYNSLVGQVGVAGKAAISMFNQQEMINFELDNRREQVSGVSLDEEMVNLIRFQYAYQASAKMIGIIDEMLQTLIGLGR
mgnify:CR=1 FL=1